MNEPIPFREDHTFKSGMKIVRDETFLPGIAWVHAWKTSGVLIVERVRLAREIKSNMHHQQVYVRNSQGRKFWHSAAWFEPAK